MGNPKALPCDQAAIRAAASVPACAARKTWVLTAAVLGSTLAYIDESVVNIALPKIESDLHTTLAAMQWVVNAYTLCLTALLLIGGATADQFGRRRVFLIGTAVFAVASVGCGLAPGVPVLIAARTLQGAGAALLVPCSLALIGAAYGEKERGTAIGIWSGASAIASGAAPILGGWLVDHSSWRVIFLINPLLAIPTLWIAVRHVPESRDPEAAAGIDWRGALLGFAGLAFLVYGLIDSSDRGWQSPAVSGSVSAGLVLLAAFVLAERASRSPMMPLGLFRSRTFTGVNLLTLLLYGALGGAFFFVPFLLIQSYGYSATAAGAAYLPFTVVLGVLSKWSGGLADRFGARGPLVLGPAVTALGFAILPLAGSAYWAILVSMTVMGFGMLITVAPLTTTVINAVPARRTGVASGINNAVASVGGLLLIAVLGSVSLTALDRELGQRLAARPASPAVRAAVEQARGGFVIPPLPAGLSAGERQQAHAIVADSLAAAVRLTLWIAVALTLASAAVAAATISRAAGDAAGPGGASPGAPRGSAPSPPVSLPSPG
jgi:EmrB/QacA subfamily drug resistance transporter